MADVDPPLVVYNATPGSEMQMEPVSKPSFPEEASLAPCLACHVLRLIS
jgi:hypothetical protein